MIAFSTLTFLFIALRLADVILTVWCGVLIFRNRGMAGWMALSGAILGSVFMIGASLGPYLLRNRTFGSGGGIEWYHIYQAFYLSAGVGHLVFLGGVLLHLTRRKSEAHRIGELEAIIRDLHESHSRVPAPSGLSG